MPGTEIPDPAQRVELPLLQNLFKTFLKLPLSLMMDPCAVDPYFPG